MPSRPRQRRRKESFTFETLEPRLPMAAQPLVGLAGDWDGDGVDTPALYDPTTGTLYLRNENTSGFPHAARTIAGATPNLVALAGDWDGDGQDTLGLYNTRTRTLAWSDAPLTAGNSAVQLNQVSGRFRVGTPVAGDFDGDGDDSLAIFYRPTGRFYVSNSLSPSSVDAVLTGWPTDPNFLPVAGDWNGDDIDEVGALNKATGRTLIPGRSLPGYSTFARRTSRTSQPMSGDWDGDGRDSLALLQSSSLLVLQKDTLGGGPIARQVYVVPSTNVDPQGGLAFALTADDKRITEADVEALLRRAAAASASNDAIIAIVDREGDILGVRVEGGVTIVDPQTLVFAIDGAVAKARTGAFFSNSTAPLTSRTIRFISQSTITEREVESNPSIQDPNSTIRGPGFVAPIGVGGHFPPGVQNTPHVDLFRIEHTNRDSIIHPGPDSIKGTADDIPLPSRFNVPNVFIPAGKEMNPPESYGFESGVNPDAQSRGIATLPGGIPLFKNGILVGGIGVFFPGPDGFATHEQGFVPGTGQTAEKRTNAARVLEAEWIAFAAAGGSSDAGARVGTLNGEPNVAGYNLPSGRIDLAGITLEIYGPHPKKAGDLGGAKALLKVGQRVGRGSPNSGSDQPVNLMGDLAEVGEEPPDGWLVLPHAGDGLTAADVQRIITQGIAEANKVRAQIRLQNGKPGARTRMVLSVADTDGNVLGLFRMPDATVFSIDVAVAKARNTAYYADPADLINADRVDDNRDGNPDLKRGIAFTNRTFRFLAEPRYPSGVDGTLRGAFSILRDRGINRRTAENLGPALPASVYSNFTTTVLAFDAFNPGRNFRDPENIANQNGVVFFPGSTPLYKSRILVGGFGVSGDGVDQDDVVTFSGSVGYQAPSALRADQFKVRGVRLPFQKFPRNPRG